MPETYSGKRMAGCTAALYAVPMSGLKKSSKRTSTVTASLLDQPVLETAKSRLNCFLHLVTVLFPGSTKHRVQDACSSFGPLHGMRSWSASTSQRAVKMHDLAPGPSSMRSMRGGQSLVACEWRLAR